MKNWSLMSKQLFQVAVLILIAVATLITAGVIFTSTLHNMTDSFKKDSYQSIDLVLNADRDLYQAYTAYHAALISTPGSDEYVAWYDDMKENLGQVNERMSSVRAIVDTNPDMQSMRNTDTNTSIQQNMIGFFPSMGKWVENTDLVLNAYSASGEVDSIRDMLSTNADLFATARSELNTIGETLALYPDILANKHIQDGSNQQTLIYVIAGFVLLLAVLFYIFSLRKMISKLGVLANKQSQLAGALRQASLQLSGAGQQLSQGSNEQAASIEETSASMEETLSMVKQNVENTRQTRSLSEEASDSSSKGATKMMGMNSSMEELKRSSNEISKIIKVIDEIAFQTNILALNAAVEAARAGEAGLGFAVVAEEVRNLAQRSAQAAKDTAVIIEKNIELSDKGLAVSRDVNNSLDEISVKTRNVNQLVAEIAAASEEQSRGITQVTEAISQMEQVVQENAATAEESAATAQELLAQAEELENAVHELNDLLKGDKNNPLPTRQSAAAVQNQRSYAAPYSSAPVRYMGTQSPAKIRPAQTPQTKKVVSPNDVIPLDGDDDF